MSRRMLRWPVAMVVGLIALLPAAVLAQVSVTATAGTVGPTSYTTLRNAFAAINAGTHQGAIHVSITSSFTESSSSANLNSSGAGSAAYTSVIVQPANDNLVITCTSSSGNGVIQLNGADNVTIDGDNPNTPGTNRNLTIRQTPSTTTYKSVIRIATGGGTPTADNVVIQNLILEGSAVSGNSSSNTAATSFASASFGVYAGGNGGSTPTAAPSALTSVTANPAASGTTINGFVVANNSVNQCGRGIVFNGAAATVSTGVTITSNVVGPAGSPSPATPPFTSPATTVYAKGIWVTGTSAVTVTGNTLQNIISYILTTLAAIEVQSPVGPSTLVADNIITTVAVNNTTSTSLVAAKGIVVVAATSGTISGNRVINLQSVARVDGASAIEASSSGAMVIERNIVSTIHNRGSSAVGVYGINITNGTGTVVRNNMISDVRQSMTGGAAFSTTQGVFGIRVAFGADYKIHHNSVNLFGALFGSSTSGLLSAAFGLLSTSSSGCDVRNNVFVNTVTGGNSQVARVAVYLPAGAGVGMNLTLDHNAYVTGSDPQRCGVAQVGTTAGAGFYETGKFDPGSTTPAANLRSYTSPLSGAGTNDRHSFGVIGTIPFVAPTDLHVSNGTSTVLESRGASGTGVTSDIDGQARPGPAGSVNGGGVANDLGADEFDARPIPTLTPDANPVTCEGSVRFIATTAAGASGSMQFLDGGNVFGDVPVVDGYASVATVVYVGGPHTIQAVYGGDGIHSAGQADPLALTVLKRVTQTAIVPNPNLAFVGDPVEVDATVTPTDVTGLVDFLDGAVVIGTASIVSGAATLSTTFPTGGSHSLRARYQGDACDSTSTSPPSTLVVHANPVLMSSPNPSVCGTKVDLLAALSSSATGTIDFHENGVLVGTSTVANGHASLSLPELHVGAHTFTAAYNGDATHPEAISDPYTHSLIGDGTRTTIGVGRAVVFAGDPVTLTGTVDPNTVAGVVEFLDGAAVIGSSPIASGSGSLVTTFGSGGTHVLRARYPLNGCDSASVSAPLSQVVHTSSFITSDLNPALCGTKIVLTAFLPLGATGTVDFRDGGVSRGSSPVSNDQAILSLANLPPGAHTFVAAYSGDEVHAPANSDPFVQTVQGAASTQMTLAVIVGEPCDPIILRATVTPSAATGLVRFLENGVSFGTAAIDNGVATLQYRFAPGNHTVGASYDGALCYNASTSTQRAITQGINSTSVTLTSDLNPAAVGHAFTMRAHVTPTTATGTVRLLDGGATIGSATLANGEGVFSVTPQSTGNFNLVAGYDGDACHQSSQSAPLSQAIVTTYSTTNLSSNPNPSSCGSSILLQATVTPAVNEGSVTFKEEGNVIGTAPVVSGSASLSASPRTIGTRSFTAFYGGGTDVAASVSSPYGQMIGPQWIADATLISDHTPGVGEPVQLTAFVNPSDSPGDFEFLDGPTSLGFGPIVNGETSVTVSFTHAGRHFLRAIYSGTDCIEGQTSDYLIQVVHAAAAQPAAAAPTATRGFQFAIGRITPNPVRNVATIDYGLARVAKVRMTIVDIQGRTVATLLNGVERPGAHQVMWNGRRAAGRAPAGLYFVRYETPGRTLVKRFVLH